MQYIRSIFYDRVVFKKLSTIIHFWGLFLISDDERIPEYAGKKARYAEVVVDLEHGKPAGFYKSKC